MTQILVPFLFFLTVRNKAWFKQKTFKELYNQIPSLFPSCLFRTGSHAIMGAKQIPTKQPLQNPYHSLFELSASALPNPQKYSYQIINQRSNNICKLFPRRDRKWDWDGEYGQHYVLCHTEVQVPSVCVFFLW